MTKINRKTTLQELQSFLRYQTDDDAPSEPDPSQPDDMKPGDVASHTPSNIDDIPHEDIQRYSPEVNGQYRIRLYAEKKAEDHWVGKLKFSDDWVEGITGPLHDMELEYEPETHSLVAKNVRIDDFLVIETYKVHLVVGSDPNLFGFRDVLTWRISKPGHPLEGYVYVTAYVWCLH